MRTNQVPQEKKPLEAEKTTNTLNPHDAESGNRTRATWEKGVCSHDCYIHAPHSSEDENN